MFINSIGQKFKLGTRKGQLFQDIWAASSGLTVGGWNHLKALSLICLVTDASYYLGPLLGESARSLTGDL